MLRTRNDQPTLWESILPEDLRRLPAELARVDALLDEEAFFAPFRPYFDPCKVQLERQGCEQAQRAADKMSSWWCAPWLSWPSDRSSV